MLLDVALNVSKNMKEEDVKPYSVHLISSWVVPCNSCNDLDW